MIDLPRPTVALCQPKTLSGLDMCRTAQGPEPEQFVDSNFAPHDRHDLGMMLLARVIVRFLVRPSQDL